MARILIVEDEPLIAMQIEEWLIDLGHDPVGPAYTLEKGLALLSEKPDAAIVDVTLGSAKSYPLADRLIDLAVPFVMASGLSASEIDPRYAAITPIQKPYHLDEFNAAVAKLVGAATGKLTE